MQQNVTDVIKKTIENVAKPSVMVVLGCFTDAELLWQHAKLSLPWQQGSVGVQFE